MLVSIGVWLALFCGGLVDCLTCLHCTDTQNPRHCKHVAECLSGEVCRIHQKTTKYGEVLFDLGCTAISTCLNRSHGIHACDECCSSNLCNSAGCGKPGYPSNRGPICYSCSDQSTDASSCHSIDFCGNDEMCMISEEREFEDIVYTSQCVELTHCETIKKEVVPIIGRSIMEDTRSVTEMTCHKCCHDDLCNARCDTKVDFCATNPCLHGTCVNNGTDYTCTCDSMYTGRNCSDVNYCTSSPCVHGKCVNGMTGYTCVCDPMYYGQNCSAMKDCNEVRRVTNVSGVYRVRPVLTQEYIEVYCDMATDGGGWTVFQRRVNGSVDFHQNFSTYEHGFGNVYGEFWLGLNNIHTMTSSAPTELRIDLMAADGSTAYEGFPNFRLSASPDYTLHIDPGHGTAGDNTTFGLSYNNRDRFFTYDRDEFDCAKRYGAWWFNACGFVNLNGRYVMPGTADSFGINYYTFKLTASMKETKMMFRRV